MWSCPHSWPGVYSGFAGPLLSLMQLHAVKSWLAEAETSTLSTFQSFGKVLSVESTQLRVR
jgi:hypothetical protein